MGDLSGPKLRVGQVEKNVTLIKGNQISVIEEREYPIIANIY